MRVIHIRTGEHVSRCVDVCLSVSFGCSGSQQLCWHLWRVRFRSAGSASVMWLRVVWPQWPSISSHDSEGGRYSMTPRPRCYLPLSWASADSCSYSAKHLTRPPMAQLGWWSPQTTADGSHCALKWVFGHMQVGLLSSLSCVLNWYESRSPCMSIQLIK